MKHFFRKLVLLFVASALLSVATTSIAQVRTNPTLKTPTPGGNGPIISNGVGSPDLVIRYPSQAPCAGNSCNSSPPPSTHLPGSGFCGPWAGGNQRVYFLVVNIGSGPSANSLVGIEYSDAYAGNFYVQSAPSLQPGESVLLSFNVPAIAWTPGSHSSYHFILSADQQNSVAETNERNNHESSYCMGPAS